MHADKMINFQLAAADALQSMTKVLKEESSAEKSYEELLDGAKSLAAGLGGMIEVFSYRAREYEAHNTHQLGSEYVHRQRRSIRSQDPAVQPRSKRDAAAELQQAKNEVQQREVYYGFHNIFRSNEVPLAEKKREVVKSRVFAGGLRRLMLSRINALVPCNQLITDLAELYPPIGLYVK